MPELTMKVNGEEVVTRVDGLRSLADVLRENLALTGTKIGCREGECGACTVLLDGEVVNSCLLPAMKAMDRSVTTIEGIGSREEPHPVQIALAEGGGVQCGICTPGFVMSAIAYLNTVQTSTVTEAQDALAGNLCRCTGYLRIVTVLQTAAQSVIRHEMSS